jgi:histidinol-phosphate aminotransferase
MNLHDLVRPNIWNLTPYSCARSEFSGKASVFLDANENPFNSPYNRYPDPLQVELKRLISAERFISADQIFLGVGSDECIDLAYRVFCEPGVDNAVAMSPSYGMYQVCADVNNIGYREVPLTDDFQLDVKAMFAAVDSHTKLMWLCSPNNPTGNAIDIGVIRDVCQRFHGIVIVDEAYGDFSSKGTMLRYLDQYPNLIVLQTMSKAWGSASVRLGMAFASPEIIAIYNKVKYPYNISLLTQQYAINAMRHSEDVRRWVDTILSNMKVLVNDLQSLPCVRHIYPSDANFVLVRVEDADALYDFLLARGIIVRNRNRVRKCLGCLRITVGTADENNELINALSEYGAK